MKFLETRLSGIFEIHLEENSDERGFFARAWCEREFALHNLNPKIAQCNVSLNKRKGTLRGLHYQEAPYQEAKLVRCTRGAIYDVAVDLRRDDTGYHVQHRFDSIASNPMDPCDPNINSRTCPLHPEH